MGTIEIFLNFPVADMNRNVLWRDPSRVRPEQANRLTAFWGDESWRNVAYSGEGNLFRYEEKQSNEVIAKAFRHRLKSVGGFKYVAEPMPMRNSRESVVYYLFFASPNPVAHRIVTEIFEGYGNRGGR